ncbi:MAG TPA: hypothetical protein PLY58_02135 [Bacilli bacterium]|jgi:signal peptidase I|nr:hypothetical protein [Bacilli bacterium]HPY79878.1 hypothetical protein [Bacilli bacterium]HQA55862.1 hypothetical protein [Bacilli bacterium]
MEDCEELIELIREKPKKGKGSLVKKIFHYLVWFFILYGGGYLIFDAFLPSSTANVFGYKGYIVQSDSMEGKFNKFDLVFVTPPNFEKVKVGDIVTYQTYVKTVVEKGTGFEIILAPITNTHYLAEIEQDEQGFYYRTMPYNNFHLPIEEWNDNLFDKYYDKLGAETKLRKKDILGEALFSIPYIGVIGNFFDGLMADRVFIILLITDAIIFYSLLNLVITNLNSASFDDVIVIKGEYKEESS